MSSKPTAAAEPSKQCTLWQPIAERDQISEAARLWKAENADLIKSWEDYIDKHGLPLEKYRPF